MAETGRTARAAAEWHAASETFHGILFDRPEQRVGVDQADVPTCFRDLNLDQVIESVTAGRDEYRLKPFFYAPLPDLEAISYRHEIFPRPRA